MGVILVSWEDMDAMGVIWVSWSEIVLLLTLNGGKHTTHLHILYICITRLIY